MRRLVIDASVAVKFYFPEPDTDLARRVAASFDLIAPDLLVPEFSNTCWKKASRKEISSGQADLAVAGFGAAAIDLHPCSPLARRAVALSIAHNHPAYDFFYLALAEEADCPLVTADERFRRLVSGGRTLSLEQAAVL